MDWRLERLERVLRSLSQATRSIDRLELSTFLLKVTLEVALFAAALYFTSEMVAGIWRLAQSFSSAFILPS